MLILQPVLFLNLPSCWMMTIRFVNTPEIYKFVWARSALFSRREEKILHVILLTPFLNFTNSLTLSNVQGFDITSKVCLSALFTISSHNVTFKVTTLRQKLGLKRLLVVHAEKKYINPLIGGGWTSGNDGASTVEERCQSSRHHELATDGGNSGQSTEQLKWCRDYSMCCRYPAQLVTPQVSKLLKDICSQNNYFVPNKIAGLKSNQR